MSLDLDFEHERVAIVADDANGVTAIVAVHSTALGPAMGGLRLRAYDQLSAALDDVLRLSRAMSVKNALAGLELGGGKMVLLDDGGWRDPVDRARRMRAVGRIVETLAGDYITAEDVGTTPLDMEQIATVTKWVAGQPPESGGRGDPSSATARTVLGAIRAAVRVRLGADLSDVTVGVQGAGHVGCRLVDLLCDAGARVEVTDVVATRAEQIAARTGAHAVSPDALLSRPVDVLAPCAFGEVISPANVGTLRCSIVVGAANNPLSSPDLAVVLAARDVLYVPDFLANCGGIIHVGAEPLGLSDARVDQLLDDAVARTAQVLNEATAEGRLPLVLAQELAARRIAGASDPTVPVRVEALA